MLTKFVRVGICKKILSSKYELNEFIAWPLRIFTPNIAYKPMLIYTQIRGFNYDEINQHKRDREKMRDSKRKNRAAKLQREIMIDQEVYENAADSLISKFKVAFIKLSTENDKNFITVEDLNKQTIGIRIKVDSKPNPMLYDTLKYL